MKKRIIALLLAAALLLPLAPVRALADTGPRVSVNTNSVYPGSWVSVAVSAEEFSGVAALDLTVRYDSTALTLTDAGSGYLLSGAITSVNRETPGVVTLSTTALDGLNGYGELLWLQFYVPETTPAGNYPVTVAVGDAYDTSLLPVTIGSSGGNVQVLQYQQTAQPFYLWMYPDRYELQQGDEVNLLVVNNYWHTFAAADFTVEFDSSLFELEKVTLSPAMTVDGAVYSVNTAIAGAARIVYASNVPVSAYELFTVKLKVIGNVDSYSELKVHVSNAYHEDLTQFLPYSTAAGVQLVKKPEVVDHPNAWLSGDLMVVGRQTGRQLILEAGSGVAAGDFTLNYDPAVLRCVKVSAAPGLAEKGGMIVVNDHFGDGVIRFSYVNEQGYDAEDLPLVDILWEPLDTEKQHYQITVSAVGVVDTDMNRLTLEYITDAGCMFRAGNTYPPTCTEPGYTEYSCRCGNVRKDDILPKLGHSYSKDPLVCDRCGHSRTATAVAVESLPDKLVYVRIAEPLNLAGGTIRVTMDDGETVILPMTEDMVSGFDNSTVGEKLLTVSYGGCQTAFPVTVRELVIRSVELIKPKRNVYLEGDTLDLSGGYLEVFYDTDNNYTQQIPLEADMVTGFDPNLPGKQTLTVTYLDYTFTFTVEVTAKSVVRIEITTLPKLLSYFGKRDALDVTGGRVAIYYDNGTQETVDMTAGMVSGFDNTVAGIRTLTVTVGGKTDTFDVEITTATVRFVDYDGRELSSGEYMYLDPVAVPENPERPGDETYTYTFAGWDKTVEACTGDAVYTAVYTPVYIDYTVTFRNADGSLISSRTYHYGETVEIPAEPEKPADVPENYVFKGWGSEISVCTGDAEYTAVFEPPFARGDLNQDGSVDDLDVEVLLWYTLFGDLYPVPEYPDYNNDGEVNDMDVEYLLWHTLFPDMNPL